MGADFYTRIAPWTKTATGPLNLAAGVRSGVLVAAPPAGFSRYVLSFLASCEDNVAGAVFELQTSVNFVPIARVVSRFASMLPVINELLTNPLDSALVIQNVGLQLGNPAHFCIVFADTPPNVLSNTAVGQVAG